MAHFYRVGAVVLLALCVVMLWTPSYASFPPSSIYKWQNDAYGSTYQFDTAQQELDWDLAGAIASASNCGYYLSDQVIGTDSGTYRLSVTNPGCAYVNRAITRVAVSSSCPANSTLTAGVCSCNATFTESGSTCVPAPENCAWSSGQALGKSTTSSTVEIPKGSTAVCMFGCRWNVTISPDFWWQATATGPYMGHAEVGTLIGAGSVCNGTEGANGGGGPAGSTPPVDPAPVPKPPCAPGYIPGTVTVNGVTTTLCQPAINTENVKKKEATEQTPDGPKTVTTSETTVCTGAGSCTTTTTTSTSINGAAPTTATKTETQSKAAYCAAGEGKKECGTGSGSWQGNCDTGFTGEGDPVTVAMAKEIHVQNCLLNKPTDESTLYGVEAAKTGDQTGTLPGNKTVTVGAGDFDSSDALGGASCIADKTVVVWGRSVVLPFSTVCPALGYLKIILLSVSWLAAAGIVIGRKT